MEIKSNVTLDGNFSVVDQIISLATSVAPIAVVAGALWVANLDVDKLDGKHATDFALVTDLALKQDVLSGSGLVKSTAGVVSYITDNTANWNIAHNRWIGGSAPIADANIVGVADSGGVHTWGNTSTNTPVSGGYGAVLTFVGASNTGNGSDSAGSFTNQIWASTGSDIFFRQRVYNYGSYTAYQQFWTTKHFSASNVSNWNTAYGWGNHAGLYRPISYVPAWADITGIPSTFVPAAHTLDSHSNVTVTSVSTNQLIRWSGSSWVNWTPNFLVAADITGKENTITAGTTAQYWRGDKSWQTLNTASVPELTNLYYTDTRARAAISGTGSISYNSTTGVISYSGGAGVGTVTSVALSVPTGLSVTGSPITSSGTLAVTFTAGYSIPTTATQATWTAKQEALSGSGLVKSASGTISYITDNSTKWNKAYDRWAYGTNITYDNDAYPRETGSRAYGNGATTGGYPSGYGTVLHFNGNTTTGDGDGIDWGNQIFISTGGDMFFRQRTYNYNPWSAIYQIWSSKQFASTNIANWNTAYGWGNHASAGYVPGSRTITVNGTAYDLTANRSWTINVGVTSIAMSVPTGFSISGSPVTSTGTLALSFSAGYALPTTAKQTQWDSVYNRFVSTTTLTDLGDDTTSAAWNAGYYIFGPGALNAPPVAYGTVVTFVGNTSTGDSQVGSWHTQMAFSTGGPLWYRQKLYSYGTPIAWRQIWTSAEFTSTQYGQWNTAYGWGNHASAGYALSSSLSGYVPTSRTLTINGTSYDLTANRSWTVSSSDTWQDVLSRGAVATTKPVVSIGTYASGNEYIRFQPTDFGTNKPYFAVSDDNSMTWSMYVFDGTNFGTVNIVGSLKVNGSSMMTATSTDTLGNKSGNISMWTNDVGYITSSSLTAYVYGSTSLTGGGNAIGGTQYITLVNDSSSPGNNMLYGTNSVGTKGWHAQPSGGSGAASSLVAGYDSIYGSGYTGSAIYLNLVGDQNTPGNDKYYGTNSSGSKGWYSLPSGGGVSGSGSNNRVAVWTGSGSLGDSGIYSNAYFGSFYKIEMSGGGGYSRTDLWVDGLVQVKSYSASAISTLSYVSAGSIVFQNDGTVGFYGFNGSSWVFLG